MAKERFDEAAVAAALKKTMEENQNEVPNVESIGNGTLESKGTCM